MSVWSPLNSLGGFIFLSLSTVVIAATVGCFFDELLVAGFVDELLADGFFVFGTGGAPDACAC